MTWPFAPLIADYHNLPAADTAITAEAIESWQAQLLRTNEMATVLFWDSAGSTYTPSWAIALAGQPRLFVGPTDPQTVSGVTWDAKCLWWNTTPVVGGGGGGGGTVTTVAGLIGAIPTLSFASSTNNTPDLRLSAALSYAAAQTSRQTIQLEQGATYSTTQTLFNGCRIIGSPHRSKQNQEISGVGVEFKVIYSGSGSWFVQSGAGVYDVALGGFAATSTSGAGTFLTTNASGILESVLYQIQLSNFKNGIGTPTAFASFTDTDLCGDWTINAGTGPQLCLAGSDNNFFVEGSCNIGAGGASGAGSPLMMLKTGKTVLGPMYFTAIKDFYGINLQGDLTSFVGNTFGNGIRFEGRSTSTPSNGALIICEGGQYHFTSFNTNYGGADLATANSQVIPGGSGMTARSDRGMIQVNGGEVSIGQVTYDKTAAVAWTFPLACVINDADFEIKTVRTGAKGGDIGTTALTSCTLTASSDLVTKTAHGLTNGRTVKLTSISVANGLTASQSYFVINSTANTFQLARFLNGVPLDITADSTATCTAQNLPIVRNLSTGVVTTDHSVTVVYV